MGDEDREVKVGGRQRYLFISTAMPEPVHGTGNVTVTAPGHSDSIRPFDIGVSFVLHERLMLQQPYRAKYSGPYVRNLCDVNGLVSALESVTHLPAK
jgi:hypothetical protein